MSVGSPGAYPRKRAEMEDPAHFLFLSNYTMSSRALRRVQEKKAHPVDEGESSEEESFETQTPVNAFALVRLSKDKYDFFCFVFSSDISFSSVLILLKLNNPDSDSEQSLEASSGSRFFNNSFYFIIF